MDNLENKAKFFAQYWGNVTEHTSHDGGIYFGEVDLFELKELDGKVLLTPLSSITDQDAIHVATLCGHRHDCLSKAKNDLQMFIEGEYSIGINSIDYLRSKGYALPFLGLSVEKQIEYGWIKLI